MIATKNEVYNFRCNRKSKIYVDIINENFDVNNENHIFQVVDFVMDNGLKIPINNKTNNFTSAERLTLKNTIKSQLGITEDSVESEKMILDYALMYFLNTPDEESGFKGMYNVSSEDWEIVNENT